MATQQSITVSPPVEYRNIEGAPGYRVGSDGSIWSHRSSGNGWRNIEGRPWRLMSPMKTTTGYYAVTLMPGNRRRMVHHLILLAFVGPRPEGMECCHYDGNAVDNLRWDTRSANNQDKKRHGTSVSRRGEKTGTARATDAVVRQIRAEYAAGGVLMRELATKYDLSKTTVVNIINRQLWKHVD